MLQKMKTMLLYKDQEMRLLLVQSAENNAEAQSGRSPGPGRHWLRGQMAQSVLQLKGFWRLVKERGRLPYLGLDKILWNGHKYEPLC